MKSKSVVKGTLCAREYRRIRRKLLLGELGQALKCQRKRNQVHGSESTHILSVEFEVKGRVD